MRSKVSLLFGPTQNFLGRPIMVDAEVEFLGLGSGGSVSGDALWNPRGKGEYPRGISGVKADVKVVPLGTWPRFVRLLVAGPWPRRSSSVWARPWVCFTMYLLPLI